MEYSGRTYFQASTPATWERDQASTPATWEWDQASTPATWEWDQASPDLIMLVYSCLCVSRLQLRRRTFLEADLIDERREKEERLLVVAEEREREAGGDRKQTSGAKGSPSAVRAQLGRKGRRSVTGKER